MSRADDVFAMFVQANPVPDVAALESRLDRPSGDDLERGGMNMRNAIEPGIRPETRAPHAEGRRWSGPLFFVAAAALVVVLVGGAWMLAGRSSIDIADPNLPIEDRAVAAAERHLAAVNSGDIDTINALAYEENVADTRMWEFNAAFAAAGYPTVARGCEVVNSTLNLADVRCAVEVDNPVFEALGVSDLVAPFLFLDGRLAWKPWEGGDFSQVNAAFAAYLQANRPDEYETACSPRAFVQTEIVQDQGIALTPECAALELDVIDDVARWVREGMPAG